jgi:hypothetical protein
MSLLLTYKGLGNPVCAKSADVLQDISIVGEVDFLGVSMHYYQNIIVVI